MFRIKTSEVQAQIPKTAALVLCMLLLAFALSVAATFQVYAEYHLLGEWQTRSTALSSAEIGALRTDIGSRIITRAIASAILLLCTLAMVWLQQRQLAMLRVLYQVKLFALEILASMDQGVITTDLQMVVTGLNSAAVRVLGLATECIGRPLESLSLGGGSLVDLVGLVAERNAAVWDHDFTLDRGGRLRRIRADAHVLKDTEGQSAGWIIFLRDVSDRVQMEERVHLMERFASLGTLAAGLHHEIKNPLTALSIHVQLLEKRLAGPEPKKPVDDLMGVVKSEVHRLNAVLDSFRDFASLHRLTLRPANVQELLEDMVRLIGPQAVQQHVEVTLRRPEGSLSGVLLDSDKFKQAVLNLVLNALEAMPEGGSLVLGASTREGELWVEVTDTGPGIPPELRQDLFKPYFSTKGRGTGMGLALAEKVISQHGGRIEYRTGPAGTTFSIAIPLEPASETEGQP